MNKYKILNDRNSECTFCKKPINKLSKFKIVHNSIITIFCSKYCESSYINDYTSYFNQLQSDVKMELIKEKSKFLEIQDASNFDIDIGI